MFCEIGEIVYLMRKMLWKEQINRLYGKSELILRKLQK